MMAGAARSAGQAAQAAAKGEAPRRKYGELHRDAENLHRGARVERGRLVRAESAVCVGAAAAAGMRAASKFGLQTAGGDLASLALLTAICWYVDGNLTRSSLYRSGADPGVLVGCTAVPALIVALLLRCPEGSGETELEAALFFLRIAVSCSGMAIVEGVLGDGRWGGSGTQWRDERRPAGVLVVLSAMAAMKHPTVPWPVPFAALTLAAAMMRALLRSTPGSFTLGEAALISTGATLLIVDSGAMFLSHAGRWEGMPLARRLLPVDMAVQSLLGGTLLIVVIMWHFMRPAQSSEAAGSRQVCSPASMWTIPEESKQEEHRQRSQQQDVSRDSRPASLLSSKRGKAFTVRLVGSVGVLCIPSVSFLLGQHFFVWVAAHIAETYERLALLAYWLAALGAVVAYMAVIFPRQRLSLPKTIVRKSYHILALLLFGPGQVLQPETMRLAYAASFALLCTLELVRGARLGWVSDMLQRLVDEHKDERDGGVVVLTHIYLLLGCAIPSFLCPYATAERRGGFNMLLPLAGVLIVGIGDTAASVYGKMCGRTLWHKIPISSSARGKGGGGGGGASGGANSKTIEGTVAGALCTLVGAGLAVCVGGGVGGLPETGSGAWVPAALGVAVASLAAMSLEAFTEQIDNLVLPLWYFTMLSVAIGS